MLLTGMITVLVYYGPSGCVDIIPKEIFFGMESYLSFTFPYTETKNSDLTLSILLICAERTLPSGIAILLTFFPFILLVSSDSSTADLPFAKDDSTLKSWPLILQYTIRTHFYFFISLNYTLCNCFF